jgi:flagellar protein FlgJ
VSFTSYTPRPSGASLFDLGQLDTLKRQVRNSEDAATDKKVAQQFEALFIQMLLKQAHQGPVLSQLFNSSATRMANSLGDGQMALQLSNPGIGLAQALLAQIQARRGAAADKTAAAASAAGPGSGTSVRPSALHTGPGARGQRTNADIPAGSVGSISALLDMLGGAAAAGAAMGAAVSVLKETPEHVRGFVAAMSGAARAASQASGVPLKLMLGQAALESGWGTREIRGDDGTPSHNLFGIKAGAGWTGKVVQVLTTEYQDGVARKVVQPFRAYDSYRESFDDYARLISQNQRYQDVMAAPSPEAAALQLQDAGYATDPDYASKLISIMGYFGGQPA